MIVSVVGAWTEVVQKSGLSSFPAYGHLLGAHPLAPPAKRILDKLTAASSLTLPLHLEP